MTLPTDWRDWPPYAKQRLKWRLQARDTQLTPEGDWNVWLILAGRGWGKTRTGAEDAAQFARENPRSRQAVIAPTYGDARDTCVEGDSGLLNVLHPSEVAAWNRSLGELVLTNRSRFKLFSAEEPDRLRGPQHHRVWAEELAAWEYQQATWDMAMFGLRLGDKPRAIVTTTPKPTKLIRSLSERTDVHITKGSTFDNAPNLSEAALEELRRRYEGTRLGRQELYAEILLDVPGALWTLETIRKHEAPDLTRVVVGVDPAVTADEDSDSTGIVVAGKGTDALGYVLADRTCKLHPEAAMRRAIQAYKDFQADRIVIEKNNGGDYLPALLRTIDPNVPVTTVVATRGKALRAEPVAALYEQERVYHTDLFAELEDQMCSWTPEDGTSPDRLDALVWAFYDLFNLHEQAPVFLGAA